MKTTLKCEICGYESKQLFQHLKSEHGMSVTEYRKIYGESVQVQIGFNAPKSPEKYNSDYVKRGHKRISDELDQITELYSKTETINMLSSDMFYKTLYGRGKFRTLIKSNPKLYKSIYLHSSELERMMPEKGSHNFTHRLEFLVDRGADIENLNCKCGSVYTWTSMCRYCPIERGNRSGTTMSDVTRQKCRVSALKSIAKQKGQLMPRYNVESISIIEEYGKDHGYNFQHAENGGEFHIKELGYFVDGYDVKLNVVLEIDEPHHFKHGKLRERDIIRQREIEDFLKCKFIRIKYEK